MTRQQSGIIITAFAVTAPKRDEVQLWPPVSSKTVMVEGQPLRFPNLRDLHLQPEYNRKQDALIVSFGEPVPAVSYDVGDDLWLRVVRETGEVVGLEIEAFERGFLVRHPELAAQWKALTRRWSGFRHVLAQGGIVGETLAGWLQTRIKAQAKT